MAKSGIHEEWEMEYVQGKMRNEEETKEREFDLHNGIVLKKEEVMRRPIFEKHGHVERLNNDGIACQNCIVE